MGFAAATSEHCFRLADLVAVIGGANACIGVARAPVVMNMGCGVNTRCTANASRASSGVGSGSFEGPAAGTIGKPAAAATGEDFVAPTMF